MLRRLQIVVRARILFVGIFVLFVVVASTTAATAAVVDCLHLDFAQLDDADAICPCLIVSSLAPFHRVAVRIVAVFAIVAISFWLAPPHQ